MIERLPHIVVNYIALLGLIDFLDFITLNPTLTPAVPPPFFDE